MTATTEFVVPKSIPIILLILNAPKLVPLQQDTELNTRPI